MIIKASGSRLNQRSAERVPRTNRITIRVIRLDGETPIDAKLLDVSHGGIGFESASSLESGERLRIRIEIETTQIVSQFALFVEGAAVVRRCQELPAGGRWRIGASWDRMDRAEKEKWSAFMGKARPLLL